MLPETFFECGAEELAQALLGRELVHETQDGVTSGKIVETEAYHQSDEASHSFRGKTKRNQVMFGPAGRVYIYFTYGMHYCFNVTAEEEGVGAAVLIRALAPKQGVKLMKRRRRLNSPSLPVDMAQRNLCSGPAKLVQAMGITMDDYGINLRKSRKLYLRQSNFEAIKIASGPRIGISRATGKPWRFWIEGNSFVSR